MRLVDLFLANRPFWLPLFVFYLFSSPILSNISVVDDLGNQVTLKSPAKRVISLSPGITELIFTAGGGNILKGVVSYSNFPEAAKSIPQIGSYNALDLEAILNLKPDLIISWKSGNPELQVKKLLQLGLNVYVSEPKNFDAITKNIRHFGILMNTEKIANTAASEFETSLNQIINQYSNRYPKKSVFIQIWHQPIMSISGQHLISQIVGICNGVNIFNNYPQLTLTPSTESIISTNPDVIIVSRDGDEGKKWLDVWRKWPFINAVKQNQLLAINADNLVRYTTRIIPGIREVCSRINRN